MAALPAVQMPPNVFCAIRAAVMALAEMIAQGFGTAYQLP
ncbi:MAG: hypothetical protein GQF41_3852 [Candidatus Rifleibacterium amylolyticum]|nr:MAG: hypothetical protein GQF41_3852 [Candidatus Rifleibacterium amylolyticum]